MQKSKLTRHFSMLLKVPSSWSFHPPRSREDIYLCHTTRNVCTQHHSVIMNTSQTAGVCLFAQVWRTRWLNREASDLGISNQHEDRLNRWRRLFRDLINFMVEWRDERWLVFISMQDPVLGSVNMPAIISIVNRDEINSEEKEKRTKCECATCPDTKRA